MAKTDLRYVGLVSGLSDGEGPRLHAATASGQIREIPLTRHDLVRIIQRAAAALEVLDREEGRT